MSLASQAHLHAEEGVGYIELVPIDIFARGRDDLEARFSSFGAIGSSPQPNVIVGHPSPRAAVGPTKIMVTIGLLILLTMFIVAQTVFLSSVYMFVGHNIVTHFTGTADPPLNIIQFMVRLEIAARGGLVIGLFSGVLSSGILGFLLFLRSFRSPEVAGRIQEKLQFLNRQDKDARMVYLLVEILSASSAGPIGYLILSPHMGSDRIGLNLCQVWVVVLLGKLVTVSLGRLWGLVRRRSEPARSPLLGRWTIDATPTTDSR